MRKQIHSLSQHFKYIIIDLGSELEAVQMGMIEDATAIIVVTTPEVLVVNQTRRLMNDLLSASVPGDFIQMVLNKVIARGLDPNAISQSLRRPIVGHHPSR